MNKEQLAILTENLKKRKIDLMNRLKHLNSDRHRENKPLDHDFSEQAVETANDEVIDRLHEGANEEIKQINQALERIKQNQFGFCSVCGEAIPDERLKIIPGALTCVKCAK